MASGESDERRRRLVRYAFALALQLALAPWFIHDWDGFVFQRAADDLLGGATPYEVAEAAPAHVFLDDHWPPVNTWYAYPPLPLLLFTPLYGAAKALVSDPATHRLALKVPFILGNLALAFAAGLLVRDLAPGNAAERAARRARAERWILFNPFLIFIGAVWGMFDAVMMALLLASVLLVERGRVGWGGVAFAAAALCKLFPLFVSPLFAYYVWRRRSLAEGGRFVAAAVAAYAAVCLPFFLRAPWGFLNQWVLMHGERSPQGFALVSAPLHFPWLNQVLGWPLPVVPEAVVVAASTAILAVVLLLANGLAWRAKAPLSLLHVALVAFLATLLASKVVNEQYLVMPISLLAVLALAWGDAARARLYRRAFVAFTAGGFVSSLLLGFHFITFIPADVAARTIRVRPDDVVAGLATSTGLPIFVIFSIPHFLATLALVPALVATLAIVAPALWTSVKDARRVLARALEPRLSLKSSRAAAAFAVALLIAAPPVATALLAHPDPEPAAPPLPAGPLVAFRYDLAIRNPSYDPAVRDGFWLSPYPRPDDGYYTTNVMKVRDDLRAIADLGASVVVVGFDAGNRLRLATFLEAAADAGIRVAPAVDVKALADCPEAQYLPIAALPKPGRDPAEDEGAGLLARCAARAVAEVERHPYAYRVDGRPVLFVLNATSVAGDPAWVERAVRDAAPQAHVVAGHDVARAGAAWADARYPQPPQAGAPAAALDAFEAELARGAAAGRPVVAPVFPATWGVPSAVDGESTLARSWAAAARAGADVALLPWNLYREGSHVEPAADGAWVEETRAHVDAFLR